MQDVAREAQLRAERAAYDSSLGERDLFIRHTAATLGWDLPGACVRACVYVRVA